MHDPQANTPTANSEPMTLKFDPALPANRTAAMARIARIQPAAYARTRNDIGGAVTGLSPYLTHGLMTMHEVLVELLKLEPLAVSHKLVYELGWREFFRHAWSHAGDGILQSLHPGPLPDDAYATVLPADIREARTGVPVIDEAVRSLYATGTLHNHARMWLASYAVHIRQVHWRAGADWLVAHLLDGDLASNHLSWQWVAGTGSHKPYLFNADNVARYAPVHWHSHDSVIDLSYERLDLMARTARTSSETLARAKFAAAELTPEPPLHTSPPSDLQLNAPDAAAVQQLKGRDVWLVHPWALRAPPADLNKDTLLVGVYLREHHETWPWSEARWRWVDTAMAEVTRQRWWVDSASLNTALMGAASVRSVEDPHITQWLKPVAQLDRAPSLFPQVDRQCTSFSQWWTRATRGINTAEDLLACQL
jgi:deoxyribodipyrimidine photo-lyase